MAKKKNFFDKMFSGFSKAAKENDRRIDRVSLNKKKKR
jgi:hypothetical protein